MLSKSLRQRVFQKILLDSSKEAKGGICKKVKCFLVSSNSACDFPHPVKNEYINKNSRITSVDVLEFLHTKYLFAPVIQVWKSICWFLAVIVLLTMQATKLSSSVRSHSAAGDPSDKWESSTKEKCAFQQLMLPSIQGQEDSVH